MPETGMDYWTIGGVIAGVVGVWIAWRQLRGGGAKTTNTITGGSRNTQSGGQNTTVNTVENGNDNNQSG